MAPKKGYNISEERKIKMSNVMKEWHTTHNHPRGMLGRTQSEETRRKMSEAKKGKHYKNMSNAAKGKKCPWAKLNPIMIKKSPQHSKKTILKMKNAKLGEKHWNWQGGKSLEPYDKNFNNKFKRAIRKRDNQVCMVCGMHREKLKVVLNIHHINYNKKLSIPQNCISLCTSCHMKTNFNRKYWIQFLQNLLSDRYGYQYSETNDIIFISNNI